MSSQFNYELDERQIRLMMQDAESSASDTLWQKFESMSAGQSKTSVNMSYLVPNVNLGISRSIIVPILFIVLIGGLSAVLFSFVDFKKKEAIQKEVPFVAVPEISVTPTQVKKPITKPKLAIKPVVIDTIQTAVINTVAAQPSVAIVKEQPKEDLKITHTNPKNDSATLIEKKKDNTIQSAVIKKKKPKTVVLPTINTSTTTNLNEGIAEPELELK